MKEPKFGGKMELLKLSRLKQQLRALFTDVKEFRERERSTTEQLHFSIQKQKQSEVQFEKKLKELESELASLTESRQKLERKVSYLQNDNSLLEIKQKELNATVQSLLQSREQFVNAYQESTYDMKRSIEARDRKLKIFSEKLKSHFLLFDSIEKEALSVKQVVDNVRHVVNEKEEAVIGFKRKFDRLSEVEKVFMEKIREMEERLGKYKDELQRKETLISELEAKLEEERSNKSQTQMETLQKELSKKDAVIQNLILEKHSLDSELKSLGAVLEKIQHAFTAMNEDKGTFLSIVESTGKCCTVPGEEMKRIAHSKVESRKYSEFWPALGDKTICAAMQETNNQEFHAAEPAFSTTQSVCSGPESTTTAQTKIVYEAKCNQSITAYQDESECSTIQAETSEHPK